MPYCPYPVTTLQDILTDINMLQTPFLADIDLNPRINQNQNQPPADSDTPVLVEVGASPRVLLEQSRVHLGFLTAFRSVLPALMQVEIVGEMGKCCSEEGEMGWDE